MPRTVLHGVDQSALNDASLPSRGNEASSCFLETLLDKRVYSETQDAWLPEDYIAAEYDFATQGGAVGDIDLGVIVPEGTIILDGMIDVITAVTGESGASFSLEVESAEDILADAVVGTNGTEGLHDVAPVGTAATAVKTTDERSIVLAVANAALTAGKLRVYLRCLRGKTA